MNKAVQIILLLVAFAAAFFIGFIPAHLKYKSCDQAIQKLDSSCSDQIQSKDQEIALYKDKLQFQDIKNTLINCLIELEKNNYGNATDIFKNFIEKYESFKTNKIIQGKISDSDIMRDDVITALAKNDPKVKEKIIAIIEKFHSIQ